jgi:protein-tyrosine phosphatase/endonuclease/exonuclease/phosphatase family metal-dependent hydrolase
MKSQMTFEGSAACGEFASNPFARSGAVAGKCMMCGDHITLHSEASVSENSIKKHLESSEKVPSRIIHGLYLGGFVSAMNIPLLLENNIRLVINTARDLESHFPKFAKTKESYTANDISVIEMNWVDSEDQEIDFNRLASVVLAMRQALVEGNGVLVHCAQGRSRSSTVVVAYLMQSCNCDYETALGVVQEGRSMAQPNSGFQRQLRQSWPGFAQHNEPVPQQSHAATVETKANTVCESMPTRGTAPGLAIKSQLLGQLGVGAVSRGLRPTTTRVRQVDGSMWSERIGADGEVRTVSAVKKPLPVSVDGSSWIPGYAFSVVENDWQPLSSSSAEAAQSSDDARGVVSPLSVVSYNVWFSQEDQEARSNALVDLLTSLRPLPSVICLQEVTVPLVETLARSEWARRHFVLSDSDGSTCCPYGVMMLVNKELGPPQFTLHALPTNMNRQMLMCQCGVDGSNSSVVFSTSHLESMDNADMRVAQLDTIFNTLEKKSTGLVVFAADTNYSESSCPEIALMNSRFPEFVDVGRVLHSEFTFPAKRSCAGQRLDKIYARCPTFVGEEDFQRASRMVMLGGESLVSSSTTERKRSMYISDHAGILMTMEFSSS